MYLYLCEEYDKACFSRTYQCAVYFIKMKANKNLVYRKRQKQTHGNVFNPLLVNRLTISSPVGLYLQNNISKIGTWVSKNAVLKHGFLIFSLETTLTFQCKFWNSFMKNKNDSEDDSWTHLPLNWGAIYCVYHRLFIYTGKAFSH